MPVALFARCPTPILTRQNPEQDHLEERVSHFAQTITSCGPEVCFGLELRAAYLLEMRAKARCEGSEIPPYRQFFLRPAVEPILYSYLTTLVPGAIDPDVADSFMSCLHGMEVERRRGPVRIKPNPHGNFVQFPDPEYASDYHLRLREALPSIHGGLNRAAFAFAEILLSHPYADGNGRLARAIALLCLNDGEDVPFLPLGPTFYACAPRVAHSLETLAATGNWSHFMSAFCDMIEQALLAANAILGRS